MEAWRTYTPDGRMLEIEHAGGAWKANCGDNRGSGSSALEAIVEALRGGLTRIGAGEAELHAWAAVHAAQIEAEAR